MILSAINREAGDTDKYLAWKFTVDKDSQDQHQSVPKLRFYFGNEGINVRTSWETKKVLSFSRHICTDIHHTRFFGLTTRKVKRSILMPRHSESWE